MQTKKKSKKVLAQKIALSLQTIVEDLNPKVAVSLEKIVHKQARKLAKEFSKALKKTEKPESSPKEDVYSHTEPTVNESLLTVAVN